MVPLFMMISRGNKPKRKIFSCPQPARNAPSRYFPLFFLVLYERTPTEPLTLTAREAATNWLPATLLEEHTSPREHRGVPPWRVEARKRPPFPFPLPFLYHTRLLSSHTSAVAIVNTATNSSRVHVLLRGVLNRARGVGRRLT